MEETSTIKSLVRNDLETAAKEFAERNTRPKNPFDGVPPCCWEENCWTAGPYESFLAGAEWMRERMQREINKEI